MQPINYALDVPPPSAAFTAGLESGGALRTAAFQDQAQQAALAQAEQARQLAAQQRADLTAFSRLPAPTAKDYAAIVFKYPALKDSMKQGWDALSGERQQAQLNSITPIFSALSQGRADLAKSLMQTELEALKNSSGDPNQIKALDTALKWIDIHPETAAKSIGLRLAGILGPEKFESMFGKIGSEARADAELPGQMAARAATTANTVATTAKTVADTAATRVKTPAELAKLAAEVRDIDSKVAERAGRLALDIDKLTTETGVKMQEIEGKYGKLEPDARAIVNKAAADAVVARNTATQMKDLAGQFEDAAKAGDAGGGFIGGVGAKLKQLTGQEDYYSQLRNEYTRIKAQKIFSQLPQGPASNADMVFAQQGFLKEDAKPKEIASFLRGLSMLQDYSAKLEDARGEWVAAVGHSGAAKRDIDIGGVKVPAGYTLSEFLKKTLAAPGAATQREAAGGKTGYLDKYGGGRPGGASGSF